MSEVRIWCLRHAESENVTARIAGAVPRSPLTTRGRRQAVDVTRTLRDEPITGIYCSTALRAQQTAAPLASDRDIDITTLSDLNEVGIGEHEGTADPAVRRHTAEVLRAWIVEQDLSQRVGDGESGYQVVTRTSRAFEQIATAHPGETVVVVGHVASLGVTLSRLCGLGRSVWGTPLAHASPFLVTWDRATWRCRSWPR
ncbi:histidine phosphatase family protein [Nocardia vulneris]|uniref:histidine phosphatase family protein n=1 Tax=Nocardia vulneris TaxID=1141657 RepID=UPI0030CD63BC